MRMIMTMIMILMLGILFLNFLVFFGLVWSGVAWCGFVWPTGAPSGRAQPSVGGGEGSAGTKGGTLPAPPDPPTLSS